MSKKISNWKKIRLLLWKNFLLQWHKNTRFQLIAEIVMPIFFCLIMLLIRIMEKPLQKPDLIYKKANVRASFVQLPDEYNFEMAYAPQNTYVDRIMDAALLVYDFEVHNKPFKNRESLEKAFKSENFWVVVEFPDEYAKLTQHPKELNFTLRFPTKLRVVPQFFVSWQTDVMYERQKLSSPRNPEFWHTDGVPVGYFYEGFIQVQHAISLAFTMLPELDKQSSGDVATLISNAPQVTMQRFPYPSYIEDHLYITLDIILPIFIALGFLISTFNTTKYVALEKEKQLKEIIKIEGVPNWIQWTAWFLRSIVILGIPCIIEAVICKIPVQRYSTSIFTHSDLFLVLFCLLVYVTAIIWFCFMMAVLFNKATSAAASAALLYLLLYAPFHLVQTKYDNIGLFEKLLSCIDFNTALPLAMDKFVQWEATSEGAQWSNLFEPITDDDRLTLGLIIVMMLVSTLLFMLICLYVEQVMPGSYGVPKKWNFPFQKEFWCSKTPSGSSDEASVESSKPAKSDAFEAEPKGAHAGLEVQSLGKRFGKKWVVKDLSFKMFENEITVLLGHNGAGKSTTIAMLTGMFPPTAGTAFINGYDIRTQTDEARSSLGVCPQHNVLFDNMSVKNHLRFFAKLKGVDNQQVEAEVERYLTILDIKKKADARSSTLSGGMKRKLSLCCALCGNTKVVFCDEPSSGLDPAARREMWELLQSEKTGRTVLLTTHFMDEAEVLGDRMAIMNSGGLKCYGTSFFLKKRYGAGYRLTCVKNKTCNVKDITKLLRNYVPGIVVESEVGTEVTYRLKERYARSFGEILQKLETQKAALGLQEFGLGVSSLEEVFLKVGAENADPDSQELLKQQNEDRDLIEIDMHEAEEKREVNDDDESLYETARSQPFSEAEEEIKAETMDTAENSKRQSLKRVSMQNKKDASSRVSISSEREPVEKDRFVESLNPNNSKGWTLTLNHWQAMLYKKMICTWRNKFKIALQFFAMVMFVIIAMEAANVSLKDLPMLAYSLKQYPNSVYLLEFERSVPDDMKKKFKDIFETYIDASGKNNELKVLENESINDFMLRKGRDSIARTNKKYLFGATIANDERIRINAWYNNHPLHMTPLTLNLALIALARYLVDKDVNIFVQNYPQPITDKDRMDQENSREIAHGRGYILSLLLSLGLAFMTAYFAAFVIKERITRSKLLQFVAGVRSWTFWLAHLLFDFLILTAVSFVIFITISFFDVKEYADGMIGHYILLMLVFCFAALLLTYGLSCVFTEPVTGFSVITIIFFFSGVVLYLAFEQIQIIADNRGITDIFLCIFPLMPHFALMSGWLYMDNRTRIERNCKVFISHGMKDVCSEYPHCCEDKSYYNTDKGGLLMCLILMPIPGIIYFVYIILKDHGLSITRLIPTKSYDKQAAAASDDDVRAEQERVKNMKSDEIATYNLVMDRLKKYYGTFYAVRGLSFSARGTECFGLLGINGAGKTTTFKMLTGDERISSGDAYVTGTSIRKDLSGVYKKIGYCPQFDALLDELTGRETLFIFCLLRGVPRRRIDVVTKELAEAFGFIKHIDKPSGVYSGGNKRKLSTALAVVGSPSVIYLDEPTSGMDPAAQRLLWNMVCQVRDLDKLIVLTTHSMGEVEALCTKIAIMVNGEFKCIGSSQHLKSKFSKGLVLKIQAERSKETEKTMQAIKDAIFEKYADAGIESEYENMLTIYVPMNPIRWSEIFTWMEENRSSLKIEDYSISQTTLEEVFLGFALQQKS